MNSRAFAAALACMCGFLAAGPAAAQGLDGCPSGAIMSRFEEFGRTGKMPPDLGRWLTDAKAQQVAPYQAFDNVYYVGVCWVSAWAIKTRGGVILIDTLHDPFTGQLIDNLQKVGIDPKDIKLVLMTHGHFDHTGGAYKVKQVAPQAQFIMTKTGWDEAVASSKASQGTPRQWTMIAPDRVVRDGEMLRLGEEEVQVLETPGHTYGTASYVFNVTDAGKTYRAITVGGLGLNAIEGPRQVEAYIASMERLQSMMASPGTAFQVHLTTHPFSNGTTEAARKIPGRKPGDAHPLVDPAGFGEQLKALREGAVERLAIENKKAGR